ncbi:MAG: serpin family protein, partial [Bacteroidia bacterium]
MKKYGTLIVVFGLLMTTIISCDEDPVPNPEVQFSYSSDFASNLFKAVINSEPSDKNVIVSPLSISTVVKMILAGAEGETAEEILNVYGDDATKENLLKESRSMNNWLESRTGSSVINLGNSFFYDKNRFHPLSSYKDILTSDFDAEEKAIDFLDNDKALSEINGWVNTETKTRIPKILDDIRPDEVMFLINALYLKADWKQPFDSVSTRPHEFKLDDTGKTTMVDMMYQDNGFNIFKDELSTAIELPYADEDMSMYFIKSNKGNLDEVISDFNQDKLMEIQANMKRSRVELYIPKFKIEYEKKDVQNALSALGIKSAFGSGANLNGMAEEKNIAISRVVHKTFLMIDEKGTEGAAVTAGGVVLTSMPPQEKF